jgi:hypothetical protein
MDRQSISFGKRLFEYTPEERGKAVKICLAISVILGIVAAVVYALSTIGTSDNMTLRSYGIFGTLIGTLMASFLLLSLVVAVGRRVYTRRRPLPPPHRRHPESRPVAGAIKRQQSSDAGRVRRRRCARQRS